jgi:hypothetical protein
MGALFDAVQRIDRSIQDKKLPLFQTKGRIGLRIGIVLSLVSSDTPDDPKLIDKLRSAAKEVLNEEI